MPIQKTVYSSLIEACKKLIPELSKKAGQGAQEFITIFENLTQCFDKGKKLSNFVERIIKDSGLDELHKASDEIEGTQRLANLQELINSAVPYECNMEGLTAFLDAINLDRSLELQSEEAAEDSVTLITLHNTTGLEFNKVVITGLEQGVFPRDNKVGADLEEERRLFYVGITRAKDELYVTSVAQRMLYGSVQFMQPSIFLDESEDAFKVIGNKPVSYMHFGMNNRTRDSTWSVGTKLYHDDYGYGVIVSTRANEGDLIIEVQFETGTRKKFLPEYQAKSLQIIRD